MDEDIQLPEIDAATAKAWLDSREAIMVDVREVHEYEFENVPGSLLLPLSFFKPATFPPLTDRKVILLCAVGKRSVAVQKQLARIGFTNLYNLVGGMGAWKRAGYETQSESYEATDFSI